MSINWLIVAMMFTLTLIAIVFDERRKHTGGLMLTRLVELTARRTDEEGNEEWFSFFLKAVEGNLEIVARDEIVLSPSDVLIVDAAEVIEAIEAIELAEEAIPMQEVQPA